MSATLSLNPSALRQAADLAEQMQSLQSQLDNILGGHAGEVSVAAPAPVAATSLVAKRQRVFTPESLNRIREAQRRRWAKARKAQKLMDNVSSGKVKLVEAAS